jgi:V/A-type H+-transporting ATPase subunit A
LGVVPETSLIEHRVMVPPELAGELTWVASEDDYTVLDPIARLQLADGTERELTMLQRWPVRRPRPYQDRLPPSNLLVTGQRVLDTFFPLAKGGTAAIPGGFGAGKTVTQHQVAKWSDADLIVYVGCGERGNEMTQVLTEFPELTDPYSDHPLMERTILIANTSNMPVAAREASIYTGITLAEYYRDMGYNIALMADSTSRWAEALREISGRLEEMPAEEGYPAYLASRLAEFYERAGWVETLGGAKGSVSIIGAVSPPGGDFSEPVTQHTTRFIRCFWALDKDLASARHYPAVNWLRSYSEYVEDMTEWWRERGFGEWDDLREEALALLQREDELQQIVKLVGPDALPDDQRLILETARLLREGFLQQNALSDVDSFSVIEKQIRMLHLIMNFHARAGRIIAKGCPIVIIHDLPIVNSLIRMKSQIANEQLDQFDKLAQALDKQMVELEADYS